MATANITRDSAGPSRSKPRAKRRSNHPRQKLDRILVHLGVAISLVRVVRGSLQAKDIAAVNDEESVLDQALAALDSVYNQVDLAIIQAGRSAP
jgi:hypothetical protein